MFQCIWCQKTLPDTVKTKDHLKPRCCGGSNSADNIRLACGSCNVNRGVLPDFFKNGVYLRKKIQNWVTKHPEAVKLPHYLVVIILRYNRRAVEIKRHLADWQAVEIDRLGHSPSAAIRFRWEFSCDVECMRAPSTRRLTGTPG